MYGEVYHAMFTNLLQHVVEKSQAGLNVAASAAVKVQTDEDVSLFGGASQFSLTLASIGDSCYFVPCRAEWFFGVGGYLEETASYVLGKFTISVSVADDE